MALSDSLADNTIERRGVTEHAESLTFGYMQMESEQCQALLQRFRCSRLLRLGVERGLDFASMLLRRPS